MGTHDGPSAYGEPTGKRCVITFISNQRIENGRLIEEWTEFGELALLQQLIRNRKNINSSEHEVQGNEDVLTARPGSPMEDIQLPPGGQFRGNPSE